MTGVDWVLRLPLCKTSYVGLLLQRSSKYLMWASFEMLEMDTDSAYFSFAYNTLDEGVKPAISLTEWEAAKQKYLVLDEKNKLTPALFKEEWKGDGMVCQNTNSKTYFGRGVTDKCSTKELSKQANPLRKEYFSAVLEPQGAYEGVNKGLRMIAGKMTQYTQLKVGLNYYYCKRKVLSDGVSTELLDI